jgi:hypothetical protein
MAGCDQDACGRQGHLKSSFSIDFISDFCALGTAPVQPVWYRPTSISTRVRSAKRPIRPRDGRRGHQTAMGGTTGRFAQIREDGYRDAGSFLNTHLIFPRLRVRNRDLVLLGTLRESAGRPGLLSQRRGPVSGSAVPREDELELDAGCRRTARAVATRGLTSLSVLGSARAASSMRDSACPRPSVVVKPPGNGNMTSLMVVARYGGD